MKKHYSLILLVFLFSPMVAWSQTSDAEAAALINLLGVQKKELIKQLVDIQPKDTAAFWKIYNEYAASNRSTAKDRLLLYEKTAYSYGNMTPARADSLAMKYFSNRVSQEKSLEDYYKKIKTATNAVTAFEFYQAEIYLLTTIRAQIMQQIPTYGALKKAMKNN